MEQISCHKCSLKADAFFVGFEDSRTPVDSVNGVDVGLILSHSLECEIGIIDSKLKDSYMLVK